jgi:hypothetical protein
MSGGVRKRPRDMSGSANVTAHFMVGAGGTLGAGAVKDAGGLGEWSAQGLLKVGRQPSVRVPHDRCFIQLVDYI